jgi:O-antigen/teichoic acid export membrane protein
VSFPAEELVAVPQRTMWSRVRELRRHPTHARIVDGSATMLIGSAAVSVLNFAFNLAVARMLGPAEYSHAAAAVTLLMLASCINLAFQLVTAKLIARTNDSALRAGIYATLLRRAWGVGIALGSAVALAAGPIAHYLRLPSPTYMLVLAAGLVFYVPLGAKRGGMQGTCKFRRLATSLTSEALVKLLAGVGLIWWGSGVMGAFIGLSASVIIAFLLPAADQELRVKAAPHMPASFSEQLQAIIFFIGQVIINNIDILMVKHFFTADLAGLYAAVALVGRLLYFATWSVSSAMFPLSAGESDESDSRRVLVISIGFVAVLSVVFVGFLASFPNFVIRTLFGAGFHVANSNVGGLLTMNALAMAIYALAVVLITYEMSRRVANTAWFQLLVSGAVILGIYAYHSSLMQVIVVQQVLRVALLVAVSTPFFRRTDAYLKEEAA